MQRAVSSGVGPGKVPNVTARPPPGHPVPPPEAGRGVEGALRRTLLRGVGVTIACMAILAAVVLAHFADDYRTACRDLLDVRRFEAILDVADGLSAERGPANSVMAEEPSRTSPVQHKLTAMRAGNDGALARVVAAAADDVRPSIGEALRGVQRSLIDARREIDDIAARPVGERDAASVRHAIHGMFAVSDAFADVRGAFAADLLERHWSLSAPLLVAEMLGDLREHAGRIASQIMAAVTTHRPIPPADLIASERTWGRLHEIWSLIGERDGLYADDPQVAAERAAVETLFFGDGLALFDHMAEQGRDAGTYDLTASAFTARFVPTLAPIERLRVAYLGVWLDRVGRTRDHALTILLAASVYLAVMLSMLLGLVVSAQLLVFRPLLTASEEVIALAGDSDAGIRRRWRAQGEMRRLFDAIDMLRAKMQERATLTEALGHLADTDGLTGLLNRRALDCAAHRGLSSDREVDSLVLIDLDHFKAINDRYGHQAGDEALRRFAALLQAACSPDVTVARFGGEEFAVLMPATSLSDAVALANRICASLRTSEVRVGRDIAIRMTASFGVGALPGSSGHWAKLVARADAALYRAKTQGRDRVCWDGRGAIPHASGEVTDMRPSGRSVVAP